MSASASIASIATAIPAVNPSAGGRGSGPPGPEPPGFTIKSAEEVATKEPNALAQKPDLAPNLEETIGIVPIAPGQPTSISNRKSQAVIPVQQLPVATSFVMAMQAVFTTSQTGAFAAPALTPAPANPPVAAVTPSVAVKVTVANDVPLIGSSASTPAPSLGQLPMPPILATAGTPIPIDAEAAPAPTDVPVSTVSAPVASPLAVVPSKNPELPVDAATPIIAVIAPPVTVDLATLPTSPAIQAQIQAAAIASAAPEPTSVGVLPGTKPVVSSPATNVSSATPTASANATVAVWLPKGTNDQASFSKQGDRQAGREDNANSGDVQSISPAGSKDDVGVAQALAMAPASTDVAVAAPATTATPVLSRASTGAVIQQITDRIEFMAAVKPREGITVHLQPPDLGSISLTVKTIGRNVEAQILASNSSVKDALEQSQPQLSASVQQRGFQLTTVTFGNQTPNSGNPHQSLARQTMQGAQEQSARSGQQQNQTRSQNSGPQARGLNSSSGIADPAPIATIRGLGRRSGVDLNI